MIALHDVGLSQSLIDHLAADDRSHPLWYRCQPAHYWSSSPLSELNALGLWECGRVTTYYDYKRELFEQCSLEDPGDVWHSYSSLQGVLAVLFIDAYEDGVEIDELRTCAAAFEFRHIERLLVEASCERESYDHWRWAFPGTCV